MAKKARAKQVKLGSVFRCDNVDPKLDDAVYARNLEDALYKIHYSMKNKELTRELSAYAKTQPKYKKIPFSLLKDYDAAVVGKYCAILNRGGQLNNYYSEKIDTMIAELANKAKAISAERKKAEKKKEAKQGKVLSIQDRLRMRAEQVAGEEFEGLVDELVADPKAFDLKKFDPVGLMHSNELKQGHLRYILKMYEPIIAELEEYLKGDDADLKEGYSHLGVSGVKKLLKFYYTITGAAEMIITKSKATKKPRKAKPKPVDKVVEKIKYKKDDQSLKIASINPIDVLGAQELWVYNTKTRKLGLYEAFDETGLYIKGTSITNFKTVSVQKTLRKPLQQLRDFKGARAKLMREFKKLTTVETKLTGRVNDSIILLRAFK